jgi:hypothetical protein
MASLRGANAFGIMDEEEVSQLMTDEYPWFTTPIAFNLRVNAALDNGWAIQRGLGFPAASDDQQIGLKADTVFLSKRKGALLVALDSPTDAPDGLSGRFSLAYSEPDGTPITADAAFAYDGTALDPRGQWFAQKGVARTTALGLLIEGMHEAALDYSSDPETAQGIMKAASERFAADAAALADEDLLIEVDLASAMLKLIEQHAPQGTLYGQ